MTGGRTRFFGGRTITKRLNRENAAVPADVGGPAAEPGGAGVLCPACAREGRLVANRKLNLEAA